MADSNFPPDPIQNRFPLRIFIVVFFRASPQNHTYNVSGMTSLPFRLDTVHRRKLGRFFFLLLCGSGVCFSPHPTVAPGLTATIRTNPTLIRVVLHFPNPPMCLAQPYPIYGPLHFPCFLLLRACDASCFSSRPPLLNRNGPFRSALEKCLIQR